jgi:hypothetical protein
LNTEGKPRKNSSEGKAPDGRANAEKRNYQQELDRILERQKGARPRLLLHSCCGPCSSAVLEYLTQFFEVSVFWYNPNIYPQAEFDRRLQAQEKLLREMGLENSVKMVTVLRDCEPWYRATAGLEQEPEGGARCTECFRLRLREAARAAAEEGCEWFCSTLTLSRHKDPVRINALGEQFAAEFGVRWLPSEFKKRGRELRSQQLCTEFGIYRQDYCGCEYSLRTTENNRKTSEV